MRHEIIEISLPLPSVEAGALAVLCRRVGFADVQALADSTEQAYDMMHAVARLLEALRRGGCDD